jgi:hypothetical protein
VVETAQAPTKATIQTAPATPAAPTAAAATTGVMAQSKGRIADIRKNLAAAAATHAGIAELTKGTRAGTALDLNSGTTKAPLKEALRSSASANTSQSALKTNQSTFPPELTGEPANNSALHTLKTAAQDALRRDTAYRAAQQIISENPGKPLGFLGEAARQRAAELRAAATTPLSPITPPPLPTATTPPPTRSLVALARKKALTLTTTLVRK